MGDILIIGGGFAGLEAARFFAKKRLKLNHRRVVLVDTKATFDFLPILPDVAGGRIDKRNASVELNAYLEKLDINFQQDEVIKVDTKTKEVFLKNGPVLSYEFLLVAPGSETDYYNQEFLKEHSLPVKTVEDALNLGKAAADYADKKILIVGGGYTGIEIAVNLAVLLRRRGIKKYNIQVIEKDEDILSSLPEWMRNYCRLNLCACRINVHYATFIKDVTEKRLKLANGAEFENYLLIWTAGVTTPFFVRALEAAKDKQGRLIVDEFLRFDENCYAAGDAASFQRAGLPIIGFPRLRCEASADRRAGKAVRPLRMAVQFSCAQGRIAAKNILRSITGRALLKYRSFDLGFLVPLANKKACGKVLFFRVFGILGWFLHYCMCMYRSVSFKNRIGIFSDIFLKTWR